MSRLVASVELIEDTKIPNAATVKVVKQDHTLGNMLRAQLLTIPQILFAGYKVPHPLHPYFIIKIQTDGTITPQAALEMACNRLIATLQSLTTKFKREFSYKDIEGGTGGAATAHREDAYGATGAASSGAWGNNEYLDLL